MSTTSKFWTIEECFERYTLCDETDCNVESKFSSNLIISNPSVSTGTL